MRIDCPATNQYAPELRRIAQEFQGRHVAFYLVYPDPEENKRAIENHMAEFGFPGTPLRDPDKELQKTGARDHDSRALRRSTRRGNLKVSRGYPGTGSGGLGRGHRKTRYTSETKAIGCSLETFNQDIAPIIYKHFVCRAIARAKRRRFATYLNEDVKKRAKQIADVTKRHFMPPWLPQNDGFADDQRLSNDEIEAISSWASAGAPEGPGSVTPPQFTEGWHLGPPDLIVEAPERLHTSRFRLYVYWNFVLSPLCKDNTLRPRH